MTADLKVEPTVALSVWPRAGWKVSNSAELMAEQMGCDSADNWAKTKASPTAAWMAVRTGEMTAAVTGALKADMWGG